MTVSATVPAQSFAANGVTVAFPFTFKILATADVRVITVTAAGVETVVSTSDYTVTRSASGGTVTFSVAPANGLTVFIRNNRAYSQTADIKLHVEYRPDEQEGAIDSVAALVKQLHYDVSRCIKVREAEIPAAAATTLSTPTADRAGGYLGFDASGNVAVLTGAATGLLIQEAANVLAQRNGVNAQTWRLYNTWTDASNYERFSVGWASNILTMQTEQAGTGSARELRLGTGGTASWSISTSQHLLAVADNTYDIGASGATRPRTLYLGTNAIIGGRIQNGDGSSASPAYSFSAATDLGFLRGSATSMWFASGSNGRASLAQTGLYLVSGGLFGWSSNATNPDTAADVLLNRGGAAILELKNGTNAQTLRVYGTTTGPRYGVVTHSAAEFQVYSFDNVSLGLGANNAIHWRLNGSGHFVAATDNTPDIGASGANRPRSIYWGTQAVAPAGSVGTPSITFAGSLTSGFYARTTNAPSVSVSGAIAASWESDGYYVWNRALKLVDAAGTNAAIVDRDGANILAVKNGTNAQEFRVYNTTTGPEYGSFIWSSNVFHMRTIGNRAIRFQTNGANAWDISTGQHFVAAADNTFDIGASGATRPRTIYAGTSVLTPIIGAASGSIQLNSSVTPLNDNGQTLGTASSRMGAMIGVSYAVYQNAGDTQPFIITNSSGISFGNGGSSAVDITFRRTAINAAGYSVLDALGTLTGSPADYGQIHLLPQLAGAFTVTRYTYLALDNHIGAATVTNGCALGFNAAPGTHIALAANNTVAVTITSVGPTGAQTTIQGWIKMNINGTVRYVPFW